MSDVNECMFYRGSMKFFCYVDDNIFAGPLHKEIEKVILDLMSKVFNIYDKGNVDDYLGITVKVLQDAALHIL
eukprot:8420491-Ditylum_brightwellii.AAC.1